MEETGTKETIFNSDECQALLDLIDKVCTNKPLATFGLTTEEEEVYKKIEEAGKFYVPKGL